MSDHFPFEIQVEIIRRLPVRSLIQSRSVSKAWKSLIDSSDFIADYSGHHTRLHHLLVCYLDFYGRKCVSIADDDTFPQHKVSFTLPPWLIDEYKIIGCSHGLLCFYSLYSTGPTNRVLLWNFSIRKAVAVVVPNVGRGIYHTVLGFGVCHETNDPKIVKITETNSWEDIQTITSIPWQVEVFTLSTGAWRRPYSTNLPRKSIRFDCYYVAIDGLLYWLATDEITVDGGLRSYKLIISFDLTSEEFREINLPNSLADHESLQNLSLCKRGESLVVLEDGVEANNPVTFVWIMEDGVSKSFTKLFTVNVNMQEATVMGFRKSGETIIESLEDDSYNLVVYEPYSKRIDNVVIQRTMLSYSMYPYMETLLLNQPTLTVHNEMETLKFEDDLLLKPDFSC